MTIDGLVVVSGRGVRYHRSEDCDVFRWGRSGNATTYNIGHITIAEAHARTDLTPCRGCRPDDR